MTQIFDRPALSNPEMVRDLPNGSVIAWEMVPGELASLAVGIVYHAAPDEPTVGARTWIACWTQVIGIGAIASPPTVLYEPGGPSARVTVESNNDAVAAGLTAAVTLCSTNWDPDRQVENDVLPIARVFTRYLIDANAIDVQPIPSTDPPVERRDDGMPVDGDVLRLRRLAAEMVWARTTYPYETSISVADVDAVRRAASTIEAAL